MVINFKNYKILEIMKSLVLDIVCYRKKYYVCYNGVKLSVGYSSSEIAKNHLEDNKDYYRYWADSASTSTLVDYKKGNVVVINVNI